MTLTWADVPTPPGYRRVDWDELLPDEEVYLLVLQEQEPLSPDGPALLAPGAAGPYRTTAARHRLLDREGKPVQEFSDRLLKREPWNAVREREKKLAEANAAQREGGERPA